MEREKCGILSKIKNNVFTSIDHVRPEEQIGKILQNFVFHVSYGTGCRMFIERISEESELIMLKSANLDQS